MTEKQTLTAIVPCNDIKISQLFYENLGFSVVADFDDYKIMSHPCGADLHLNTAVEGWLIPRRNPFGLYFYIESVDEIAKTMDLKAESKDWGMYEIAFSDPDETAIRVGWPTRLRKPK